MFRQLSGGILARAVCKSPNVEQVSGRWCDRAVGHGNGQLSSNVEDYVLLYSIGVGRELARRRMSG
jgi:hypothetical protein